MLAECVQGSCSGSRGQVGGRWTGCVKPDRVADGKETLDNSRLRFPMTASNWNVLYRRWWHAIQPPCPSLLLAELTNHPDLPACNSCLFIWHLKRPFPKSLWSYILRWRVGPERSAHRGFYLVIPCVRRGQLFRPRHTHNQLHMGTEIFTVSPTHIDSSSPNHNIFCGQF